ncbi:MAG: transcription termination/antitermination protein NusA, partial [Selenomonadaceae bacterium]
AVNEEEKISRVVVPDYQLSLAIGKEGQNARLAAKLTGWKIDIKSETQSNEGDIDANMNVVEVITTEAFTVEGE